jgi:hypothetical protein
LLNVRDESHIRPKILLRPLGISLEIGPLAVHHQDVFHFLLLVEFGAASCAAVTAFVYRDLASWVANCRTSIGMSTDAAEIRPAMA